MEDFSFPILSTDQDSILCHHPFSHLAASSLWFFSPASVSAHAEPEKQLIHATAHNYEEACNEAETVISDEGGDRMDLLWEYFNEDSTGEKETTSDAEQRGIMELCCMQALAMPKGVRRPSLLMILKVLKKMFSINRQLVNTRNTACWIGKI